jgi:S-formylglutathione hydrolase
MPLEIIKAHRAHGGTLSYARHPSTATGTPMTFSIFIPPGEGPFPLLVWLSGLTCTEDNFTTKAGAYAAAAQLGLAIAAPDTSPRGEGVADDPAYDLGQGAGFYVDATRAPWAPHFQMERYIAEELPPFLAGAFPVDPARMGISGHSMGGHGALTLALRRPNLFRSVSAFSPIVAPASVPWGRKAFTAYLGPDEAAWAAHDATQLIASGAAKGRFDHILIDQGEADSFLTEQLRPELMAEACRAAHQKLTLRMQPGYDHSYFFVASFISEHLAFHAARLKA